MIDIHSHFLPDIDDGPYEVVESLNILKQTIHSVGGIQASNIPCQAQIRLLCSD